MSAEEVESAGHQDHDHKQKADDHAHSDAAGGVVAVRHLKLSLGLVFEKT
jgi:hypothetical protein